MPEVIIKYENPETLKVLEDLSKTLDFEIETSIGANAERQKVIAAISVPADEKSKKEYSVNGVTILQGDPNIDVTELRKAFTGNNIDAKKLREAWHRPR